LSSVKVYLQSKFFCKNVCNSANSTLSLLSLGIKVTQGGKAKYNSLKKVWAFPGLFFWLIFHQFSFTIQYYLVFIWSLVMLLYPQNWRFPRLCNSPISRARTTHSSREHRRRESNSIEDSFSGIKYFFINFFVISLLQFWWLIGLCQVL